MLENWYVASSHGPLVVLYEVGSNEGLMVQNGPPQ